jgi:ribosome-associated heat shock protein Hsp15
MLMKKTQSLDTRAIDAQSSQNALQSMRIDKWLWAARFFKTRSIAKEAIEGGKVHYDGDRVKVSKEVRVGMELTIRQGFDEKTVVIKALSEVRGGAPQAQLLYEETPHSVTKREFYSSQRKLANLARPDHRPSKRDRRHIHQFKQENSMSYSSDDEGY